MLPTGVEVQALVQALAATHSSRNHEVENLHTRLSQLQNERARETEQSAQIGVDHEAARHQNAELLDESRRRHLQEVESLASQLADTRRRGDEAADSAVQHSESLSLLRATFEAAEQRLEDAEITHAELLQRALRAENLCRQLTAKVEDKNSELKRANEDREGLLGEVERRQVVEHALVEVSDAGRRMEGEIAELRRENLRQQRHSTTLEETQTSLEEELRRVRGDAEDQQNEVLRRAALLDSRAEDSARRLASNSATIRATEAERDNALRESSWLRCELAALQRLERERDHGRNAQSYDADAGSLSSTIIVEQRLRERAEQAHSNALDFNSGGRVLA